MPEDKFVKVKQLTNWQRLGVSTLFVVGALLLGGVVFIFSGIYNIGAARDHWSVTNFLITILRDRSVSVAAGNIEAPDLDDPDLYLLGAEHYQGGCSSCHGTPGQLINPIYRNMLPQPPDLTGAFSDYKARELFWIVQNGLKYTGMPAWPGENRSDEVWAVVAHLAQLHQQGPEIEPRREPPLPLSQDLAGAGTVPLENCVRCHGDAAAEPVSSLVPRLHGLPLPYLRRTLEEYRNGKRSSGIMQPIAHEMTSSELDQLSAYYASLPAVPAASTVPKDLLEKGHQIAEKGIPEQDLPACSSCHGGANPQIPPLEGQSARFMATQLDLWRETEYRQTLPYGSLMSDIGKRMTADDAWAVSVFYESVVPVAGGKP